MNSQKNLIASCDTCKWTHLIYYSNEGFSCSLHLCNVRFFKSFFLKATVPVLTSIILVCFHGIATTERLPVFPTALFLLLTPWTVKEEELRGLFETKAWNFYSSSLQNSWSSVRPLRLCEYQLFWLLTELQLDFVLDFDWFLLTNQFD